MKGRTASLALLAMVATLASSMTPLKAEPQNATISIVAFGDSLPAGYDLPPSQSFAAQLEVALQAKGHKVQVVNAGVSGDTTSGGLERLEWTLQSGADAVILELGANDALRGIDPKITRANLDKMLTILSSKGVAVLLAGMKSSGNWGGDYQAKFDAIFPELAKKHGVPLYPFFLDGVALNKTLVMPDGLHPTRKGVAAIVERILPSVEELVTRAAARKAAAN